MRQVKDSLFRGLVAFSKLIKYTTLLSTNKKLSYRLKTGSQQCISLYLVTFYRRNDQRPTPMSNEPADLLRIQRIYFSYARCMRQQQVA